MTDNVTSITREFIIGQQNEIIAAAYGALVAARNTGLHAPEIDAAIEQIENWKQQRDPAPAHKARPWDRP